MPTSELTLIVAATRDMGIGLNGTLPWTGLRREMAYFARVTKRVVGPTQATTTTTPPTKNAVIMGRKTWDSIPPRFRPLKGRINVVISRSFPPSLSSSITNTLKDEDNKEEEGPIMASSLESALSMLDMRESEGGFRGRVFVIGGAQIYKAALGMACARRVLLTRILNGGFGCDTFFPVRLDETEE
ncbi:dihydrofolate reductase-like domain-containing protein, partial [Echria macrotheca]